MYECEGRLTLAPTPRVAIMLIWYLFRLAKSGLLDQDSYLEVADCKTEVPKKLDDNAEGGRSKKKKIFLDTS